MDFASSGYARDFFQGQVPQIIRSLKSIADSQQKLVELQMQQNSSVDKPVENPAVPGTYRGHCGRNYLRVLRGKLCCVVC